MDEVVAQLRAAADKLDAAAVTARRAQADVEQAHVHYADAGQGTSNPDIRMAVTESRTSSEKAGRVARLLADAAEHLVAFLNAVAPGATPTRKAADGAEPAGEDLVADTIRRQSRKRNATAFLNRAARNADEIQEKTESYVEAARDSYGIVGDPPSAPSAQHTGTATPNTPSPVQRWINEMPEAAGHLMVVGLIAGIAINRSFQSVRKLLSGVEEHERTDRTRRPDSGDRPA